MNKELMHKTGSIGQDNLIAGLSPAAECYGVVIKQLSEAATIKRGTVLGMDSNGKMSVYGGNAQEKTQKFSGDASETEFTVSDKPAAISGVKVGGVEAAVANYNAYTGVVTLAEAPAAGTDNVEISYALSVDAAPCAILADDVEVGTDADAAAVAYRCGNFNPDAVILADGYALTVQDKDTLRKYGIIFTQMFNA